MSDKYENGCVKDDVALRDTVGQFFFCQHCMSTNIFCKGVEAFDIYMIIWATCKDCNKESDFAITSAEHRKLQIFEDETTEGE
jgi:hypothetical protein